MKILFDECFPRTLKNSIDTKHEIVWTQDTEFHGAEDKHLLAKAVAENFTVFITVDQNIPYQQKLLNFSIAVINILTLSNAAPRLKKIMPQLNEVLETIKIGDLIILKTEEYEQMERRREDVGLPPRRKKS
ncbi:MAG: DUF5615 family PIN-like protein [Pyrinomonadaceae bacterium]